MPQELIVRGVEPRDIEGLTQLMNLPGYRFGTLRLPFEREDVTRKRMLEAGPNVHGLVADLGGRVVGNLGLWRLSGRQSHIGQIGMGVHDDFTGQGIGRSLLAAALDLADNWLGLTRVELTVNTDNDRAIALYERSGFETEGRQRQGILRDGRLVDAFYMARLRQAPKPWAPPGNEA